MARTANIRGGIGLAAERLGHGPEVLVTTASDHVALRTPTRPDHFSGNALHLYAPPDEVAGWVQRHATTVGNVAGVDQVVLAWEVAADLAGADPRAVVPDDVPADAEVDLASVMVWQPDATPDPDAAPDADPGGKLEPGDLDIRSGADEHVMAGARALYLQAGWGTDVDYWRWHSAQQLDLMVAGRCDVWVAYAMGIPASRASLMHDRGGLAIIEDVVTHPLYRGKGLASALLEHSLDHHTATHPGDTVVIRAEADGAARNLYARLGFEVVATDIMVRCPLPV